MSTAQRINVRRGAPLTTVPRSAAPRRSPTGPQQPVRTKRHRYDIAFWVVLVLALAAFLVPGSHTYLASKISSSPPAVSHTSKPTTTSPAVATTNQCAGNSLANFVLVSISQRHMWACTGSTEEYNSPVVTGMENLAADLTPTGTYHIYAKETDVYLKGSDSTGSWDDYVNYWMPFLDNQYGAYGFHDATWRPANAFGNISPYSSNASHGCVELPLATAKWLYSWAPVGTTVTVES